MTQDFKSLFKQALPEKISQVFEEYRLLEADIVQILSLSEPTTVPAKMP